MNPSQIKFLNSTSKWNNILTFFGLSCVRETGRETSEIQYTISPARVIYCLLVQIIIIIIIVNLSRFFHMNILSNILAICMFYAGIVETLTVLLINLIQSKRYAKLLNDSIKYEFQFSNSKDNINEITRRYVTLLIFFSLFFISSFITDIVSRRNEGISFGTVYQFSVGYIYLIYNLMFVTHFSTAQLWLQKSFMNINNDLIKYCAVGKIETSDSVTATDLLNDLATINIQQKIFCNQNGNKNFLIKENKVLENIKTLKKMYNEVFKLSREVDGLFATRCVIVLGINLFLSTMFFFYGMKTLGMYFETLEVALRANIASAVKGAVLALGSIFGLIWPCGDTCKEAGKTALIIQNSLVNVQHEKLRAELKEFSVQVQQEKVYFSPHGLFFLENRMFLSVLASISSYLVILIQLIG